MARIVRIHQYGNSSVLKIEDLDVPLPAADEVQIEAKSIGLNREEVMFRTHAYWQEAQFPSRLGFEATGIVKTVGMYNTRTDAANELHYHNLKLACLCAFNDRQIADSPLAVLVDHGWLRETRNWHLPGCKIPCCSS